MSPYRSSVRPVSPGKRLRTRWVGLVLSKRWAFPVPVFVTGSAVLGCVALLCMGIELAEQGAAKRQVCHDTVQRLEPGDSLTCYTGSRLSTEYRGAETIASCICPKDGGGQ